MVHGFLSRDGGETRKVRVEPLRRQEEPHTGTCQSPPPLPTPPIDFGWHGCDLGGIAYDEVICLKLDVLSGLASSAWVAGIAAFDGKCWENCVLTAQKMCYKWTQLTRVGEA